MNVRRKTKITTTALAVTVLAVIFLMPTAGAGQVIDRIVARVNGSIILQSELDEALSYEALLNGKPFNQFATGPIDIAVQENTYGMTGATGGGSCGT